MINITIKENEKIIYPLIWIGEETEMQFNIDLAGRGAEITFLALLLGKNNQTLQLKTNVNHEAPETISNVIVKSALTDSASVNFEGLVNIQKGAKGTKAWLAAHILLLSKKAKGRTIPSLEILENDIKAGHATTVGRVNEMELFYLMSRGLSETQAKQLIISGFLQSIIEKFPEKERQRAEKELQLYGEL
jgi:Fe-S cluster assembly protein SufD